MPSATLRMPTGLIADRRPGTATQDRCRVAPNMCISAARRSIQEPTAQPTTNAAPSSALGQPIFRQQLNLRLQLLDALGEVVDQLTLGIGKSSVFEIVARVDAQANH